MTAPLSILVVDDNKDAADALVALLSVQGYRASAAYSGSAAIRDADQVRPDVVLLDIGMPKLNGYDAARRLRAAAWGKQALLVALTGWGQDEDRRRTKEAGFDAHLVKPADPAALADLLENRQTT